MGIPQSVKINLKKLEEKKERMKENESLVDSFLTSLEIKVNEIINPYVQEFEKDSIRVIRNFDNITIKIFDEDFVLYISYQPESEEEEHLVYPVLGYKFRKGDLPLLASYSSESNEWIMLAVINERPDLYSFEKYFKDYFGSIFEETINKILEEKIKSK